MNTDIMNIKEVAAYLKLTEKTAYRLTAEGKISGLKVDGSWRFKKVDIEAWIETKNETEIADKTDRCREVLAGLEKVS